jgi:hypothetical protein
MAVRLLAVLTDRALLPRDIIFLPSELISLEAE